MSETTKKIITEEDNKKDVSKDDLDKKTNKNETPSKLSESQDFTLNFDASEENELDKSQPSEKNNQESHGDKPTTNEARHTENEMTIDKKLPEKKTETEPAIDAEKITIENKSDSQNGNDDKALDSSSDDEVIQCTPEEASLKRHLTTGSKRKSDDSDDQTSKKPRTQLEDQVVSSNSEKLEKQDDKKEPEAEKSAPESPTESKSSENTEENEKTKAAPTENPTIPEEKVEKMDIDDETPETNQHCNGADKKEAIDETKSKDTAELPDIPIPSKSRMSIEVIFDKSKQPPPKPRELIEIDESGEKILLNSSQENSINSSQDISMNADISIVKLSDSEKSQEKSSDKKNQLTNGSNSKKLTNTPSPPLFTSSVKEQKQPELCNLVSDSEGESFTINDDTKSKSTNKVITIEKEISVTVTMKVRCKYDDDAKQFVNNEIVSASFDTKSSLDHSSLADTSAKESTTTGSVDSNPRVFSLNPRLSIFSSTSSGSSGSNETSDASMATLNHESVEKNKKKKLPWINSNLFDEKFYQFAENEILRRHQIDLEDAQNRSQDDILKKVNLPSSTPELPKPVKTPGTGKRGRASTRAKQLRTNGVANPSPASARKKSNNTVEKEVKKPADVDSIPSGFTTPVRTSLRVTTSLRNQTPIKDKNDRLIGKKCFARWGNYFYPGRITGKDAKGGFNVWFFDDERSTLSSDNIFPITALRQGHSIYIVLNNGDYLSAMITSVGISTDDDFTCTVETDDKKTHDVELKDIYLTHDQAEIVREEYDLPDTPMAPVMKIVDLDSVINSAKKGKSTPKNQRGRGKKSNEIGASSSGVVNLNVSTDTDGKASDTNDEDGFGGVQKEIGEMAKNFATKGPQNRIKGKAKSKKKDDPKLVEEAGPIPEAGSTLFKGMGFIIVCAPAETLDKFRDTENAKEDSYSESGTDLEGDWTKLPFLRERLTAQLTAGGGVVYENFEDIPRESYNSTIMITNLPNATAKGLLCLSVGIKFYNYRWVIRCCKENELVLLSQEILPAGWSLTRQMYTEYSERPSGEPFAHRVVAIPKTPRNADAIELWATLIRNAGGAVRIIESPADGFQEATVILTNSECPGWVKEEAEKWGIPLLTPAWIKQCLIDGKIVDHESQYVYQHNYKKTKSPQ